MSLVVGVAVNVGHGVDGFLFSGYAGVFGFGCHCGVYTMICWCSHKGLPVQLRGLNMG